MNKSFIYSDFLASIGWFETKVPFKSLDSNINFVKFINSPVNITSNTLIAYFPGCFAEFHIGHLDVVKQAISLCKEITDDYVVVIAPANSDYTTEKYGKNSLFATNKYRYDKICSMLKGTQGNVAIDLNTMLNFKCDYNFTDLLFDFVSRHNVDYDNLTHQPRILCGKDRGYFANLAKVTNKINIFYVEDTTGASSSGHIKTNGNTSIPKKNLLLRCENQDQFDLFNSWFKDYYNEIVLQLISDEIETAKQLHKTHKFDVTICKDYADFLPYKKVHRAFENPLATSIGNVTDSTFQGLAVLDSDIFSGGTKKFIASQGGTLYAIHDFSDRLDTWELLDFADFLDDKFCYPYVDISSRCSLPAFDLDFHDKFNRFKESLKY